MTTPTSVSEIEALRQQLAQQQAMMTSMMAIMANQMTATATTVKAPKQSKQQRITTVLKARYSPLCSVKDLAKHLPIEDYAITQLINKNTDYDVRYIFTNAIRTLFRTIPETQHPFIYYSKGRHEYIYGFQDGKWTKMNKLREFASAISSIARQYINRVQYEIRKRCLIDPDGAVVSENTQYFAKEIVLALETTMFSFCPELPEWAKTQALTRTVVLQLIMDEVKDIETVCDDISIAGSDDSDE